jgi:hypothetical protein
MSHVEIDCITCGGPICLPQKRYDYLVRSKELFYCSAGHEQYFMGEKVTPELVKNLRDQLKAANDRARAVRRERDAFHRVARTCPFGCGWHAHGKISREESLRAALAGHLVEVHHARAGIMLALPEKVS